MHKGLATSLGHSCNMAIDMPSNPWAFFLSSLSIMLVIASSVKVTLDNIFGVSGEKGGR